MLTIARWLVFSSQQIHHASRRSTLGGYFFSISKIILASFGFLIYSPLVRADPAKQNFLAVCSNGNKARSRDQLGRAFHLPE